MRNIIFGVLFLISVLPACKPEPPNPKADCTKNCKATADRLSGKESERQFFLKCLKLCLYGPDKPKPEYQ